MKKLIVSAMLLVLVTGHAPAAPAQDQRVLNATAVESWADQLFEEAMQGHRYSGAVVSFVHEGKLVFAKGYGYADFKTGEPVDPANTLFRIGSISKTFTATAIAQLLDQGRIGSLDDPANLYLERIQLPSPGGQSITLRHLVTHTAGFENRIFNIATDQDLEVPLSPDILEGFLGKVVNEPGRYASYNNLGTALLGLVVEDITGLPIADYFQRFIFQPLGMQRTVLNMRSTPTAGLGVSYGFLPDGEPLLIPHRSVHPFYAPIGGINSTAEDMAKFMLAQLDEGRSSTEPLMSPATFSLMHSRLAGNHPLSSGFGMIFFVWDWNSQHMIVHGGDWPGTHSGLVLFPELDAGLFISLMADYPEISPLESMMGSERLKPRKGVVVDTPLSNAGVISHFLDHFFGPLVAPSDAEFEPTDLAQFEGNYVGQSAPHSAMDIMMNFLNPLSTVRVRADGEGGLMFNGLGPFHEVAPDVFWSKEVQTSLDGFFLDSPLYLFSRDERGQVEFLTPQIGFDAWVKKGVFATPSTYSVAWGALFLVLLTGVLSILYPRVPSRPLLKWLPPLIVLALISMPAVLLLGYGEAGSLVDEIFFGHSKRFLAFAVLAHVVLILAILMSWFSLWIWREKYWADRRLGAFMRVHYTLLSIAAILLIPVFGYANLLGW